jgi:hypothetical protein
VDVDEPAAGLLRLLEGAVRGVEHRLVDSRLVVGEGARHGKRAGDVGCVKGVELHACVHEYEVAGRDRPVVVDPMEGVGVVAGRRDRVVSRAVALLAGLRPEGAFDDSLPPPVPGGAGEGGDDRVEPLPRGVDGLAHLSDLPLVFDQADLRERPLQLGVGLRGAFGQPGSPAQLLRLRLDSGVGLGHDGQSDVALPEILGQRVVESVDRIAPQPGEGGHLRQRGPRPDPEFAVSGVGVELLGGARGARVEVEGGLVAALYRIENEHGVGLELAAQARHMGEGRVGAEPVVAVVVAHLVPARGEDQPHTGEALGELGVPRRKVVGHGCALGSGRTLAPVGSDEFPERSVARLLRAVRLAPLEILLFRHGLHSGTRMRTCGTRFLPSRGTPVKTDG